MDVVELQRQQIVMPSWAAASISDTRSIAPSVTRAARLPAAALGSMALRRAEMSANSAPTKKAFAWARKPITRFVTVIPSCAAERCVESDRSAVSTPRAARSPDSAARSTEVRSTVIRANSAATNAAHAATSATATRIRISSIIVRPPALRRAGD
jgi:hypothetical protein